MDIGKRLSIVRQAKGLTIKQVAKKAKKSTYDRVETNKATIKFDELLKVCDVLDIEIWELCAEELIIKIKD